MPIKGFELVQRLQTMVQVSTRAKHRLISQEFGSVIKPDLVDLGLEDRAVEGFDFIRKWRRDEASMKRVQESAAALDFPEDYPKSSEKDLRDPWMRIPVDKLEELFLRHKNEFDLKLSEFNNLKSKATHVSAVFRPFNERYLTQWALDFRKYPLEALRARAENLRNEIVSDKIELYIWATAVYELFQDAAVFNFSYMPLENFAPQTGGRVPSGMIKSVSQRIYGQQWRLWIRENEDEIVSFLGSSESEKIEKAANEIVSLTNAPASEPSSQGNEISIRATVATIPELSATEKWINSDYSEAELEKWISLLQNAWGLSEEHLNITISLQSGSKSSELALRPMRASEAAPLIRDVLARLG